MKKIKTSVLGTNRIKFTVWIFIRVHGSQWTGEGVVDILGVHQAPSSGPMNPSPASRNICF